MLAVNKKYLTDENNNRVSVMVDIATFEKMEQLLEDYALGKYMAEHSSEALTIEEARHYYSSLQKAK